MTFDLTPTQLLAVLSVLLVVVWVWRASARRARATADAARSGARLLSLTGRVVVGAALLGGVQWMALSYPGAHWSVRVFAIAIPALLASYTLTRALTVSAVEVRRGGRR